MQPKPAGEIIEQVARLAMELGQKHLAAYGAPRSRHDFTQRQLMACLVLRAYLKTTYRGLLEILALSPTLRQEVGLAEKLPHYTTLQKFSARSKVLEIAQKMSATIGQAAAQAKPLHSAAAMDSTGFSIGTASAYYRSRSGHQRRGWIKLSIIVFCGSLLPAALVADVGPSNDRVQARALLEQAQTLPPRNAFTLMPAMMPNGFTRIAGNNGARKVSLNPTAIGPMGAATANTAGA